MATMQKIRASDPVVILVGIDFSDTSDAALEQGVAIAAREGNGAQLHVVHAVPGAGPLLTMALRDGNREVTLEDAGRELGRYVQRLMHAVPGSDRVPGALVHVRLGSPAEEITRLAVELDADLIVVGTHGRRGIQRMILGSVAERVTRLADCPVLVARPKTHAAARAEIPEIEPPCPRCVAVRRESGGREMWCAQHRSPHLGRRHTYHYVSRNVEAQENAPLLLGYDGGAPAPQSAAKPGGHD